MRNWYYILKTIRPACVGVCLADGSTVQRVRFRSAGRFTLPVNCSWLLDSMEAVLLWFYFSFWLFGMHTFLSLFFFFCISNTCVWQIFQDFWLQSLALRCWCAPQMWNPVLDRCFQVMCVCMGGREGVWGCVFVYVFALSLRFWPLHLLLLTASNLLI